MKAFFPFISLSDFDRATKSEPFAERVLSRRFCHPLFGSIAALLLGAASPVRAQTWIGGSGSTGGDWNTAANWNPATVPNSATSATVFGVSSATSVSFSTGTTLGSITFNPGASAYTISNGAQGVNIAGAGVTNSSSVTQNFTITGSDLYFSNTASAGNNVAYTVTSGVLEFDNSTSLGSATYSIASGAVLTLANTPSASSAAITVNGYVVLLTDMGTTIGSLQGSGSVIAGQLEGNGGPSQILTIGSLNTSTTFSGTIVEGGLVTTPSTVTLVKTGTGTLTLTGANTYTGGTTISGGALQLGNGGTTGSITGNVTDNATLIFDRSDPDSAPFVFSGAITGAGAITQSGTGVTRLTGTNNYSGDTTINSGTLQIATGSSAGGSNSNTTMFGGELNATATLAFSPLNFELVANSADTISAAPGTTFTLSPQNFIFEKNVTLNFGSSGNTGQVIFSTGGIGFQPPYNGISINYGTVTDGNGSLATYSYHAPSFTIASGATLNANDKTYSGSFPFGYLEGAGTLNTGVLSTTTVYVGAGNFSGVISGPGKLLSTGLLTLTGQNTYGGGTTISSGTLQLGDGATANTSLGTNTVMITKSSATLNLDLANSGVFANTVADGGHITTAAADTGNFTISGSISGSGDFTKNGSNTVTMTGSNSYGQTTIAAGTLQVGDGATANSSLGTGAVTIAQNATLNLDLAGGTFTGSVANSGHVTTASGDTNNFTIAATISGAGDFTKNGSNTVTLSQANTYQGATTIMSGTLLATNTTGSATGTGVVTVASGATLGGSGFITGEVIVNSGGTIAPGDSTLTVGALDLNPGSNLNFELGAPQPPTGTGTAGVNSSLIDVVANLNGSNSVGSLALGGALNITTDANFGTGEYRLINYQGTLSGSASSVQIGIVPGGYNYSLNTSTYGQVDLNVTYTGLQFWDGMSTSPTGIANGNGGGGTWNSTMTNWTNQPGTLNASWNGMTAVFGGTTAGTVSVAANLDIQGLQFTTNGYTLTDGGGSLNVGGSGASAQILANTGITATIDAVLTGQGGITIAGGGTIVLGGTNTYAGPTTMNSGVLSISQDANLGEVPTSFTSNAITFNGGMLQATSSFTLNANRGVTLNAEGTFDVTGGHTLTVAGVITGAGSLNLTATGTLLLTGNNNYSGGTLLSSGTIGIGSDSALGTGVATVAAGGASIYAAGANHAVSNDFTLNGQLTVIDDPTAIIQGYNLTLSGTLGGEGSLNMAGSGTLILQAANTYSLGATVAQGRLMTGVNGALPGGGAVTLGTASSALSGNIDLAGTSQTIGSLQLASGNTGGSGNYITSTKGNALLVVDAETANSSYAGLIEGPVTVVKTGPMTFALGGVNTYTGNTGIGGGVLQVASDSSLGDLSSSVYLFNSGTLQILGNVSSARSLVLSVLPPIQQGAAGTPPQFSGVAGGALDTNGFTLTWSGAISGAGQLTKLGAGTLTLTGTNTYTGGTNISGGTFAIASDSNLGASSGALNFANGGTLQTTAALTTNRSGTIGAGGGLVDTNGFDSTFGGSFSGAGSLTKTGLGALTLSGASAYTGDTVVQQGSLFVDGSIASANTVIQSGGLLGGHGALGGSLNNFGVVSPGNSPGTITVAGSYTQAASGALVIQIGGLAPAQHDLLAVGGVATLGGALQLQQLNGFSFLPGNKVTFLTAAGGVNGTFTTVSNPFSTSTMLGAQVVYGPNSVSVEEVQNSFKALVNSLPVTGDTPNQQAVAHAIDASLLDRRNATLLQRLDNEPLDKVLRDLDRLAPDEMASIFQIAVSQAKVQTFNLQRRLEDVRAGSNGFSASGFAMNGTASSFAGPAGSPGVALKDSDGKDTKITAPTETLGDRWGAFITGSGEWANAGDTSNARGYDITNAGFTLGLDYKATPNLIFGIGAGYDHADANLSNNGRIRSDDGKFNLYGSYFSGGFYSDVAIQGGYNTYLTHRAAVEGFGNGYTDGGALDVLYGAGYDWKKGNVQFGPYANFEYDYVGLGSFSERGSLAPLSYPDQHQESIRSTVGAKASYNWQIGKVLVRPEVRAAWQHEYGDTTFGFASGFASGAGPDFLVHGPAIGRDSLIINAGFSVQWTERVSTYVYYDGELLRQNYQANSVSAGFSIAF